MITNPQMHDLQPLHSFRLPAKASNILYLKDIKQLATIPKDAYVLGEGTNTIFLEDFDHPVVKVELGGITISETDSHWIVRVGAGENWHRLIIKLMQRNIFGLENMALIPGTVGAAPVQNIGAYGREVGQFIHSVQAWDRKAQRLVELRNAECEFAYRDSLFKRNSERWLIIEVIFNIPKQWFPEASYGELKNITEPLTAKRIFDEVIAIRQRKLPDPEVLPNAGSFFKNPIITPAKLDTLLQRYPNAPYFKTASGDIKVAAGWLIDKLGLKGFHVGQAAVHHYQALVLVNQGGASGAELIELASYIQRRVASEYDIDIEPEVRLLGRQGLRTL